MAFTYQDLITQSTLEGSLNELRGLLEDMGVDTTDWKPGSPSMTNLQLDAYIYTELKNRIAQQALNQLNQFAEGDALTMLSLSRFGNRRIKAEYTEGPMTVSFSGQGTLSFEAGDLKVRDWAGSGATFYNAEAFSISSGDTLSIRFRAEEVGTRSNTPASPGSERMEIVGTIVGLSVINTAIPGSALWYDVPGRDDEPDNILRMRNFGKFGQYQRGENIAAGITSIVLEAAPVDFVQVDDWPDRGKSPSDPDYRGPGAFDVYLSNALSLPDPQVMVQAQEAIDKNVFGQDNWMFNSPSGEKRALVKIAGAYYLDELQNDLVGGEDRAIRVWRSSSTSVTLLTDQVERTLNEWCRGLPISGVTESDSTVYFSTIIDLLMEIDGVRRVTIHYVNPNFFTVPRFHKPLPPPGGWADVVGISVVS